MQGLRQEQDYRLGANTAKSMPLIRFTSNAEMEKTEKDQSEAKRKAIELNNSQMISSLAGHIRHAFTINVSARQTVTEEMLEDLRQREGKYDEEMKKIISNNGGTDIFLMLTDTKCNALESWLKDIMFPAGERPYSIEPTPIPDVPGNLIEKADYIFQQEFHGYMQRYFELMGERYDPSKIDPEFYENERKKCFQAIVDKAREQAKKSADIIEDFVDDEFVEGGWYKTIKDLLYDFATFKTAFIEGPIFRKKKCLHWKPVQGENKTYLSIEDKVLPEYMRHPSYNVFPAPSARTVQDGNMCILVKYSRKDIAALRGVPGYNADIIDLILEEMPFGHKEYEIYDTEFEDLHNRPQSDTDPEKNLEAIKFWGNVQGHKLLEWGMDKSKIPDPNAEYNIIAQMIGNYVFHAKLNPHPLGKRNIYSASFRKKNDSVWGKSLPHCMKDIQKLCNALVRAIADNTAFASGPQVWQFLDLMHEIADRTNIHPYKVWEFSFERTKQGGNQIPMGFFQPPLIANNLLPLFQYFMELAGEVTGIPAYVYGNQNLKGAADTATGLSMLMNAAAKGLRNSASNIDEGIITPSVAEQWLSLMLRKRDLAKGDCKINARASDYLIQEETLQMRRKEYADSTRNNIDLQIMGLGGRAELLRETAKALKMNPEKIVPPPEKMLATQVENQVNQIIQKIAQALKMSPEQLIATIQNPGEQGSSPGQQQPPQTLDQAGNPVSGQMVRQFNQ